MKLYAFQGYRYNSATVDAALQAAPPFDQIDESLRDRLHARSPHHFARVTKPVGHGDLTPHEHSVALHREWIETGVVVRDETPSIYPYAITQPDGSSRLGLCALVGVEPGREGDLWPHEQTVAKSIAERLDLLRLSRIDIEPVFLPRRRRRHAGTPARRGLRRRRGRRPGQPRGPLDRRRPHAPPDHRRRAGRRLRRRPGWRPRRHRGRPPPHSGGADLRRRGGGRKRHRRGVQDGRPDQLGLREPADRPGPSRRSGAGEPRGDVRPAVAEGDPRGKQPAQPSPPASPRPINRRSPSGSRATRPPNSGPSTRTPLPPTLPAARRICPPSCSTITC